MLELAHRGVRVKIGADGSFALERDSRPLLRGGDAWACAGTHRDRLVTFTEGVIPHEDATPRERPEYVDAVWSAGDGRSATVTLVLRGGRRAELRLALTDAGTLELSLRASGAPLRVGLSWDANLGESFAGLGARHATGVDHGGRSIQLGADR